MWTRAEEHKVQYDIVTARAVAYADQIIPRCLPLCKKGGLICLYKELKPEEREEILIQCKKHNKNRVPRTIMKIIFAKFAPNLLTHTKKILLDCG